MNGIERNGAKSEEKGRKGIVVNRQSDQISDRVNILQYRQNIGSAKPDKSIQFPHRYSILMFWIKLY